MSEPTLAYLSGSIYAMLWPVVVLASRRFRMIAHVGVTPSALFGMVSDLLPHDVICRFGMMSSAASA